MAKATYIKPIWGYDPEYHIGDVVEYTMEGRNEFRIGILALNGASFYAHFRPEGIENMTLDEFTYALRNHVYQSMSVPRMENNGYTNYVITVRRLYDCKFIYVSIEERSNKIRVSFDHGPWELFTNYGDAFMAICGHKWGEE